MNKYFSTFQTRIDPSEARIGRRNYGQYRMFTGNIWDRSPQRTEVDIAFWNGTTPNTESCYALPEPLIRKTIASLHLATLTHDLSHAGYRFDITDAFDSHNPSQPFGVYQYETQKEYRQNILKTCGFINLDEQGRTSYLLAWESIKNKARVPEALFLSLVTLYGLHSIDSLSGRKYILHLNDYDRDVNTDYARIQEHITTAGNIAGAILNLNGKIHFSKEVVMQLEPRCEKNPAAELLGDMGIDILIDEVNE